MYLVCHICTVGNHIYIVLYMLDVVIIHRAALVALNWWSSSSPQHLYTVVKSTGFRYVVNAHHIHTLHMYTFTFTMGKRELSTQSTGPTDAEHFTSTCTVMWLCLTVMLLYILVHGCMHSSHSLLSPSSQSTGWSALFFSAERGYVYTTKTLLKSGSNTNLKDKVHDCRSTNVMCSVLNFFLCILISALFSPSSSLLLPSVSTFLLCLSSFHPLPRSWLHIHLSLLPHPIIPPSSLSCLLFISLSLYRMAWRHWRLLQLVLTNSGILTKWGIAIECVSYWVSTLKNLLLYTVILWVYTSYTDSCLHVLFCVVLWLIRKLQPLFRTALLPTRTDSPLIRLPYRPLDKDMSPWSEQINYRLLACYYFMHIMIIRKFPLLVRTALLLIRNALLSVKTDLQLIRTALLSVRTDLPLIRTRLLLYRPHQPPLDKDESLWSVQHRKY